MSALGQKQTLEQALGMSALPPKADIFEGGVDVRFVPKADIPPVAHEHESHMPSTALLREFLAPQKYRMPP